MINEIGHIVLAGLAFGGSVYIVNTILSILFQKN